MTAGLVLGLVGAYFAVLIAISLFTARADDNRSLFLANRSAPWPLVAVGMVGSTLSGVTFISIPGKVGDVSDQFSYFQMALGFMAGYLFIAYVLLPIYYRLNLTSIYGYLAERFGTEAYKTGAAYFLLSRSVGSAIRLLLVAQVLHETAFADWGIPFEMTVLVSILLIWVYTYRGGIRTIIFTDTLQTLFMLLSLGFAIYYLMGELGWDKTGLVAGIADSGFSRLFFFDDFTGDKHHFLKEFIGGFFICIGMTGMDQDMMQKNLTCKSLGDAQKNMILFSVTVLAVILAFLCLGSMLYSYADLTDFSLPLSEAGKQRRDLLFPLIATKSELSGFLGILFILGLIAAAYSSADSALTALTTSVCVDFLQIEKREEPAKVRLRKRVHVFMSGALFLLIMILHYTLDLSAIDKVIFLAGFTYGPLIGLFLFGIFSRRMVHGVAVVPVVLLSPILTHLLFLYIPNWTGYIFGGELIALNAGLTCLGLLLFSRRKGEINALDVH
jgi:Na+/proline symporter